MEEITNGNVTEGSTYYIVGNGFAQTPMGTRVSTRTKQGLSPKIYFKYVKKKFGIIQSIKMDSRIKKLEKLVKESLDSGQEALGEAFFQRLIREMRESEMYAKGYKIFIEEEHLNKFRNKVRGTSISITPLKNYIRDIPKKVKTKILDCQKLRLFDSIVIVHYDPTNEGRKMTEKEEREDPIAFGKIKESDRYYFIDDWEDKYCDLTLSQIIDKLSLGDEEITLTNIPNLAHE